MRFFRHSTKLLLMGAALAASGCRQTSNRATTLPPQPPAGTMDAMVPGRLPRDADDSAQAMAVPGETEDSQSRRPARRQVSAARQVPQIDGSLARMGRAIVPSRSADRQAVVRPVDHVEEDAEPQDDADSARFVLPPELPGSDAPPLRVPPYDPNQPLDERREIISRLYDVLPAIPDDPVIPAAASERPWNLAGLQQTAYENSPVIQAAWSEVVAAQGAAVQAGLYPNPEFGYQGDTINTADTAGYNGVFFSQTIVTAGKLDLAQQSRLMKLRAAQADYQGVRIEVASDVRRNYFKVLMARERVRLARAMATLFEEVYQAQIELVAGGESAPYEPLQLRVLALQARNDVIVAQNAYEAAWRQLAAVLNLPNLPVSDLDGSVEAVAPVVSFDSARSSMLSRHSDLVAAAAEISAAAYNRELQCVTPIPNINVQSSFFHDDTSSLNDTAYSLQIGVPLPIFNRNQGNITAAEAQLMQAQNNRVATRNRLTAELAAVFADYQSSRELAATYREQMLPNQVQTYRGVYERFRQAGGLVDFAQIVVAQQTLGNTVEDYLDVLSQQWESLVDLAELLQADDFYSLDGLAAPLTLHPVMPRPVPAAEE